MYAHFGFQNPPSVHPRVYLGKKIFDNFLFVVLRMLNKNPELLYVC